MMSLGSDRTYVYSVLYRNSRIDWRNLKNLMDYIPKNSNAFYKVKQYLQKYHWKQFKVQEKGYHKYWSRDEVKIVLLKFLVDETLGLDINIFSFFNLDQGESVELHHIFGNKKSIELQDLIPLLVSSHKNLTFTDLYRTEKELLKSNNIIFQRKMSLKSLVNLRYSKRNFPDIQNEFFKSIWSDLSSKVKSEWIKRWKDRNSLYEEEWHRKYGFYNLYSNYELTLQKMKRIFNLPKLKSKFIFWFNQSFLENVRNYFN